METSAEFAAILRDARRETAPSSSGWRWWRRRDPQRQQARKSV